MNETRQAIIKLIEPFIDKTLSEWCLISRNICDDNWDIQEDSTVEYLTITNWEDIEKLSNWLTNVKINWDWYSVYKIIGHYDITVVLKYVNSLWYRIETVTDWDFDIFLDRVCYWNIPSKPIYLFSEQEEQDLLNLLLKLKNNE
jgi:hypothetical protein